MLCLTAVGRDRDRRGASQPPRRAGARAQTRARARTHVHARTHARTKSTYSTSALSSWRDPSRKLLWGRTLCGRGRTLCGRGRTPRGRPRVAVRHGSTDEARVELSAWNCMPSPDPSLFACHGPRWRRASRRTRP